MTQIIATLPISLAILRMAPALSFIFLEKMVEIITRGLKLNLEVKFGDVVDVERKRCLFRATKFQRLIESLNRSPERQKLPFAHALCV